MPQHICMREPLKPNWIQIAVNRKRLLYARSGRLSPGPRNSIATVNASAVAALLETAHCLQSVPLKTPLVFAAFTLEDNILTGNCFGCQEGGDVITFLMKIDALSFGEAVERLADKAGVALQRVDGDERDDRPKGPPRNRLVEAHRHAQEFYADQLGSPDALVARQFLAERGFDIVSGGTDTHLLLADLRPKELTGKAAEQSLERAAMTCNKNAVPNDPEKPMITSGVRLGSPAATTRGFGVAESREVGELIADVLDGLAADPDDNSAVEQAACKKVLALCDRFPIYPDMR